MRYIASLSEETKETLAEMYNHHPKSRARTRAKMLLLSDGGYSINEIAKIEQVGRDMVASAFSRWEENGLVGLFDRPKSGRPRLLTPAQEERAVVLINEDQRNRKQAQAKLEAETGRKVSEWTFKRTLKRQKLRWKRMRRSQKGRRDEEKVAKMKIEVAQFEEESASGACDLYYFDESGVSTAPVVPYGWQQVGETTELPSFRSKRSNILGFYRRDNHFHYEIVEGRVNSDHTVACFDRFADTLTKRTIVVLDNASVHTSHQFKEKHSEWEKKGLYLYYLPPYASHFNVIEIVWRFLKYEWLPLSAYQSYGKLKKALRSTLDGIGSEYTISFA